jgi:hypothetical protein
MAALALALVTVAGAAAPRRPAKRQPARVEQALPAPRPLPPIVLLVDGHLLVRETDGSLHGLLPTDSLFNDIGTLAVSPDGRRIAFSGSTSAEGQSHIWIVNADGTGLTELSLADSLRLALDDGWPCWAAPHHLVFVGVPSELPDSGRTTRPSLYLVRDDGGPVRRVLPDRNVPAQPVLDPATGQLTFLRMSYRHGGSAQIVSMTLGVDDLRLAAGPVDSTVGQVLPGFPLAPLDDGRLATAVLRGSDESVVIFGAEDDAGRGGLPRAVGPARLLARPPAYSPSALPDGRVLFKWYSRLYVMDSDGTHREEVLDLRGSHLDGAKPLVATTPRVALTDSALDAPRAIGDPTFGYHALNIFAGGPVDASLPPPLTLRDNLRVRVVAAHRTSRGRDSIVVLREIPVRPDGSMRVDSLPVDVPLVMELAGSDGHTLLSAHGFGRTAWVNAGSPHERRCVGCHLGHSALPVPPDDEAARWFNAAPSAQVAVSSSAPAMARPSALTDRRTRGPAREVAWISASPVGQWLRLRWPRPLEIRELALYGLRPSREGRVTVRACEVVLRLNGTKLSRRLVNVPLDPGGTHLGVGLTVADEVEIRFPRVSGLISGKRAAALAEVEAIARVP